MSSVLSIKDIYKRVWGKIKADFDWSWFSVFKHYGPVVGTALLYYVVRGGELTMTLWSFAEPALYALGGAALVFFPHILWNLWLAPYRIMEERLNSIQENKVFGGTSPQPEPIKLVDFADYKNHKNIELFGAACLWGGLEPHYPLRDSKTKAKLSQLKSVIRSGDLLCQWKSGWESFSEIAGGKPPKRSPDDDQPVSMIALRKYADTIGDVPQFLQHVEVPLLPPTEEKAELDNQSS